MVDSPVLVAAAAFAGAEATGVTNLTGAGGSTGGGGSDAAPSLPPGLVEGLGNAGEGSGVSRVIESVREIPSGGGVSVPSVERVFNVTTGTQAPDPGGWAEGQSENVPSVPEIPEIPGTGGGGSGSGATEVPSFTEGTFGVEAPDPAGYAMDQITTPADVLGDRIDETRDEITGADWSAWTNPVENDPVLSRAVDAGSAATDAADAGTDAVREGVERVREGGLSAPGLSGGMRSGDDSNGSNGGSGGSTSTSVEVDTLEPDRGDSGGPSLPSVSAPSLPSVSDITDRAAGPSGGDDSGGSSTRSRDTPSGSERSGSSGSSTSVSEAVPSIDDAFRRDDDDGYDFSAGGGLN